MKRSLIDYLRNHDDKAVQLLVAVLFLAGIIVAIFLI